MPVNVHLDMNALREAHATATRKGGGFWRPENGANRLRFLPGWPGASVPYIIIHQHFLGGDENKSYTCPATPGIDRPCPICRQSRILQKRETEVEQQRGNELKYRKANLWNVLVRNKEAEGVQIFQTPWSVHQVVLGYTVDEINVPNFLDPFKGHDVIVDKSGSGLTTKYDVRLIPRPCSLAGSAEEIERIWNSAPNLTNYLKAPTDAELKAALRRMDGLDEEDDYAAPSVIPSEGERFTAAAAHIVSRVENEPPLVEAPTPVAPSVVQSAPTVSVVQTPATTTTPARSSSLSSLKERLAAQINGGEK